MTDFHSLYNEWLLFLLQLKLETPHKLNGEFPIPGALTRLSEAEVTQLCLTLCDPIDYRVRGILYARILESVAFTFSKGLSQPRD